MPFVWIALAFCEPTYSAAADRARFPPSTITVHWHKFNEARICYLESRLNDPLDTMRPSVREEIADRLREARHIQRVLVLITHFEYEPPESEEYWARWMPQAREAMGDEWYQAGWLPWGGWVDRR